MLYYIILSGIAIGFLVCISTIVIHLKEKISFMKKRGYEYVSIVNAMSRMKQKIPCNVKDEHVYFHPQKHIIIEERIVAKEDLNDLIAYVDRMERTRL